MLHAAIALLLVAQEPTFSFDVKNRPLGDVIRAVKLPVTVDEELSGKPVTLKVDNQPLAAVALIPWATIDLGPRRRSAEGELERMARPSTRAS